MVGDSGDADARYEMSTTCGEPDDFDLPEPLLPLPAGSGITAIESLTRVELREGRYNITAVLAEDPSADDAFDGVTLRVLDNQGETCDATVTVLDLPEHCVTEEPSFTFDLTRAVEPTIVEFEITCGVDETDDDEIDDDEIDSEAATSPAMTTATAAARGTGTAATMPPGRSRRSTISGAGRLTSL